MFVDGSVKMLMSFVKSVYKGTLQINKIWVVLSGFILKQHSISPIFIMIAHQGDENISKSAGPLIAMELKKIRAILAS